MTNLALYKASPESEVCSLPHLYFVVYFKKHFQKGLEKTYFKENTSEDLLWINHEIGHFLIRKVLRDIADWVVMTTMDYTMTV